MDSLQPRDQVVDKRREPDEKRVADSSMVRCRSDRHDEFVVPLDSPNEEMAEQWQDGLHDWRLAHLSRRGSVCSQVRQHL